MSLRVRSNRGIMAGNGEVVDLRRTRSKEQPARHHLIGVTWPARLVTIAISWKNQRALHRELRAPAETRRSPILQLRELAISRRTRSNYILDNSSSKVSI